MPQVKEVEYRKTVQLKQYEPLQVSCIVEVNNGEDPELAWRLAKSQVIDQLQAAQREAQRPRQPNTARIQESATQSIPDGNELQDMPF